MVATSLPGPSTIEAIRDIGLAPLGNAAQFLRVSLAGYQYDHNHGYEKWLLRGATSPWSYLLRSGDLRNSPAGGFSPTTDPLVANFNAFTSGSITYQHAAYVYDHPTLLTQDPTQLIPNLQLENLDSDYRFTTAANGNYFFNLRGLNEKQISGDTSEGLYKPWIIEPNGLLSQCVAWGEFGVEKCIPSHFVPTSVYDNPYTLTRAHESFLESKYSFVTGTAPANAGLGEKWYRSTTTGLWYYIKSNGNVYRYDSGSVAGILAGLDTFVFTTSPLVYANPLPELVNLIP